MNNTVPDPDPDPDARVGGQLSNPNECNSTSTSLVSGIYPSPISLYIDFLGIEYDFSTAPTTRDKETQPRSRVLPDLD